MLELITGLSSRLPANLLQSSTYRCYLDMTARQKNYSNKKDPHDDNGIYKV